MCTRAEYHPSSFVKIANFRKPSANIRRELGRKGLRRLTIIIQSKSTFGCNGNTGTEFQAFLGTINMNVAKAGIVADVQVQLRYDRNKKSQISIERNFEAWKGQDVSATGCGNTRPDFKAEGSTKERRCFSFASNFSRRLLLLKKRNKETSCENRKRVGKMILCFLLLSP
jgi:hypothetical protein